MNNAPTYLPSRTCSLKDAFPRKLSPAALTAGSLRGGEGQVGWSAGRYLVQSPNRRVAIPLSQRIDGDFYVSVTAQILRGEPSTSWAGVVFDPHMSGGAIDGAVFLGKNHSGLVVFDSLNGRFQQRKHRRVRTSPSARDSFAIAKLDRRYHLLLNGEEVAMWFSPNSRPGVMELAVGRHTIGAFKVEDMCTRDIPDRLDAA